MRAPQLHCRNVKGSAGSGKGAAFSFPFSLPGATAAGASATLGVWWKGDGGDAQGAEAGAQG